MRSRLFRSLGSGDLADFIRQAKRLVYFAAPGIQKQPAEAIAEVAPNIRVAVTLDFDERVMRMGFGDLDAVKILRKAGVMVNSLSGLRSSIVIVDDDGYVFTPTALYLEKEPHAGDMAPNALRLSKDQIDEVLARMSPTSSELEPISSEADPMAVCIEEFDTNPSEVSDENIAAVENRLANAPPVPFDVARQVRVYNAYLQYVELELSGTALQRRRISIPSVIQSLDSNGDLNSRLKTTFDVIAKDSKLSSKGLERKLNEIRKNFTPAIGRKYGRVILKVAKADLERKLDEFKESLHKHKQGIEGELKQYLDESRCQIVEYYLPRIIANPPDSLLGVTTHRPVKEEDARQWLCEQLNAVFPDANSLIREMKLEVVYRDVTLETLRDKEFLDAVRKAYPRVDWDAAHNEFRAAGESEC